MAYRQEVLKIQSQYVQNYKHNACQISYASSCLAKFLITYTDSAPSCFPNGYDLGCKLDFLLVIDGSHLPITFITIN